MRASLYLVIILIVVLTLLGACTPGQPTVAPTKPGGPAVATAAPPPSGATSVPAAATKPAAPAAAPTATPAAKIKRGGILKIANQNDWVTTDPLLNNATFTPQDHMMQPLAEWKRDAQGNWGPRPVLAMEWDFAEKAITIKLQKGVKFHDGSDWNARVAKFNFDRFMTNPKSQLRPALSVVDPAKGFEVVDDYTLRVNLRIPSASFLANIIPAGDRPGWMVSQAAIDKFGEDRMATNPVGTGPFEFVEWLPGDRIVGKKWANYWEKGDDGQPLPYVDGINARWINDDSVRLLEVKSGNIHAIDLIQGKDIPGVKSSPDLVFIEGPWSGNQYRLIYSAVAGPFKDNLKLRQAGLMALDRETFAKTLGQGAGAIQKYWFLPGMLGYDETLPWYSFDRAKATQLVKDAGYPNGLDVTLTVMSRQIDQQQSQIIKQMWDAVGIRTTIEVQERVAWTQRIVTGPGIFDAATMRNPARGDPDATTRTFLVTNGSYQAAHFSNPEMDQCIDESSGTYDAKKRQEIYRRCQILDYEKFSYYGQLWVQNWNWVHAKELKGFEPTFTGWDLRRAWIDK